MELYPQFVFVKKFISCEKQFCSISDCNILSLKYPLVYIREKFLFNFVYFQTFFYFEWIKTILSLFIILFPKQHRHHQVVYISQMSHFSWLPNLSVFKNKWKDDHCTKSISVSLRLAKNKNEIICVSTGNVFQHFILFFIYF